MTLKEKADVYTAVHAACNGIEFSKKNLILAETAKALGLAHIFEKRMFFLFRRATYSTTPIGTSLVNLPE